MNSYKNMYVFLPTKNDSSSLFLVRWIQKSMKPANQESHTPKFLIIPNVKEKWKLIDNMRIDW